MRRAGGIWSKIISLDNLLSAAKKAAKGKRRVASVAAFLARIPHEGVRTLETFSSMLRPSLLLPKLRNLASEYKPPPNPHFVSAGGSGFLSSAYYSF